MAARMSTKMYAGGTTALLLIAAAVLGFVGLNRWSQTVVNAYGEVCGSAWNFRPGHGSAVGGERTPGQLQAATDLCRQAARGTYGEGRIFIWWAVGICALAALVAIVRFRSWRHR